MAFDFKKEFKEFYAPKKKPQVVEVPSMNFIAVRGKGDPNEDEGDYVKAIEILYSIAFTLRMSYKGDYKIDGFFEYVVPPLEGFWWQEGVMGVDASNKSTFQWLSVIRLPDFVEEKDFRWAVEEAAKKKNIDTSKAEFITIQEGLCVQIMHIGPFDEEQRSIDLLEEFVKENNYEYDFTDSRMHHEIYLSDARRVAPEKWKTIIRHPIKKK